MTKSEILKGEEKMAGAKTQFKFHIGRNMAHQRTMHRKSEQLK